MHFTIDQELICRYPALRIGVVVGRGIQNAREHPELTALKAGLERRFAAQHRPEDVNNHPYILAWRETYRSFGAKPKDHRPTAEALLRRIVRGEPAPLINVAVNCYLLAELEHFLPVGGYDLSHIAGSIQLRFSPGGEPFLPLGGRESEVTQPGEVVYADRDKVLTRRWNYKDSDLAKITEDSTDIVLFCEAAELSIPTSAVESSAKTIADHLAHFCGGDVRYFLADASRATSWPC